MSKATTFSPEEISIFCDQIAMILNGGIPIFEGTHILYEEMEEGRTKEILKKVDDNVKAGMSFNEALKESGAFPTYMCEMVKIGEMTGKLEDIMHSLSGFYERENLVKNSIRRVISYPTVLLGMMAVILMVLVGKILPMFEDIFLELDGGTGTTIGIMNTSILVSRIIVAVVLVMLAALLIGIIWYRFRGGSAMITNILNNNPFSAGLADKISIGKFLATLAVMNAGGVEMTEAVKNASKVVENKKTLAKIDKCISLLEADEKPEFAFKETGLLNSLYSKMFGVARMSGSGDTILFKLVNRFDDEINSRLNSLASVIETILVVVLSVIVGAVLISVMMPLMSVIASIG